MADLFIKQAEQYAQVRPSYPPEFFEFIASKTPSHDLAWDVGAGSGQAARSVSFFSPSIHLNNNFGFVIVGFFCSGKIHFSWNEVQLIGCSIFFYD